MMSSAAYSLDTPALTCWKDIAHYFGKGVRTVQRWERELGLPVRRPQGALGNSLKSPVLADPRDLDAWLQSRWEFRAVKDMAQVLPPAAKSATRQALELGIQQSRELQQMLHATRQQHRVLVEQITTTVSTLKATCQRLPSC
jgi:hypothetical protein